jgi:hypothetical protein
LASEEIKEATDAMSSFGFGVEESFQIDLFDIFD